MEDLEVAYRENLEKKEETPQSRSGHGSLSKSSSNANLPKMQASHRGMSYEIVERKPVVAEPGPSHLPSKWEKTDKHKCLETGADGQQVRYNGTTKLQEQEAASARADLPIPPQVGLYYYEVTIISKGKDGMIGVGFCGKDACMEKLPGWDLDSWAYHGDDGKTFCRQLTGRPFGPTFTSEDTIGCGLNFLDGTAFFTKNGNFLGESYAPT